MSTARCHIPSPFLSGAEEIAPTPDIKELWYRQQAGKPLSISVTFDGDVTFSVVLRQQFGQIHVSVLSESIFGLTEFQVGVFGVKVSSLFQVAQVPTPT